MRYLEQEGKVIYVARDGRASKNFPRNGMAGGDVFAYHQPQRADGQVLW